MAELEDIAAPSWANQSNLEDVAPPKWAETEEAVPLPQARPAEAPQATTWGHTALDVAKQVPSAVVTGVESLATGPAQLIGLAGRGANYLFPGDPERAAEQQKIRELVSQQGGNKGVGQYLPEAETLPGKLTRTGIEAGVAGAASPGRLAVNVPAAITGGLASEGAGLATAGTEFEMPSRIAGALIGTGGVQRVASKFGSSYRGAPSKAQPYIDSADMRYTEARALGVELNPTSVSKAISDVKKGIEVHPDNAERTFKLLNSAESEHAPVGRTTTAQQLGLVEPPSKQGVTFDKLDSLRRHLGDVAANPANRGSEAEAAREAVKGIDNFLASLKPADVLAGDGAKLAAVARLARADAAAGFRMRAMDALRERAENTAKTGQSAERAFRNELKAFVRPNNKGVSPAKREGFNKQEIAALRKASHMTTVDGMLRTVGILGGYLGMAGLGGATYISHDPEYAGLAALGYGARKLGGIRARMGANRMARMVGARSPLAEEMGVRMPKPSPLPGVTLGRVISEAAGFKKGGRVTKTFRYGGKVLRRQGGGPISGYTLNGQAVNAAGQPVDVAPSAPEAPPPENPAVLQAIEGMRQGYQQDVDAYNAAGGNGLLQYGPFSPGGYAEQAMQPGQSGYFDVGPSGVILPHAFTPSQVAQQAGETTGQLAAGFGPSGSYDTVGYNIPNDRGGFFDANADSLPTVGQGLSTNNWRLLGMGPGYIMRQGNIINTRDPATRSGLPLGYDTSFSDTAESGAYSHRFVAPGAALTGRNKWDAYFWPGAINVTGYTRWPMGTNVKRGGRIKGLPSVT